MVAGDLTRSYEQVSLPIRGMSCAGCALNIEKGLAKQSGVYGAQVNFATETATVTFDKEAVQKSGLLKMVRDLGYDVTVERALLPIEGDISQASMRIIEKGLEAFSGVVSAHANMASNQVLVEYLPGHESVLDFSKMIESLGFRVTKTALAAQADSGQEGAKQLDFLALKRRLFAGVALVVPMVILMHWNQLGLSGFLPLESRTIFLLQFFLQTPVQFWIGLPFYKGAWAAARHKTSDMNTLIAVGTTAAYLYSILVTFYPGLFMAKGLMLEVYFESAGTIILLILLGRLLEARARKSTSAAISKLVGLRPKTAILMRDGQQVEIDVEEVRLGDIVMVKPGQRIPVDGVVVQGRTAVDESMISGESLPVEKSPDDPLIGATINMTGTVTFRATRVGKHTMLAQIVAMVQQAQASKPPIARLADVIASVFVPVVIGIALITFFAWLWFGPPPSLTYAMLNFVAVMVIACPCALGLATPTSVIVGMGQGAVHGILIRSAQALETAHKIDVVVMDKTGTITKGKPSVTNITSIDGISPDELVRVAAAVEKGSEHPLGAAIVKKASELHLDIAEAVDFKALPGHGIEARLGTKQIVIGAKRLLQERAIALGAALEKQSGALYAEGKSVVFVSVDGQVQGLIGLADTPKASASAAVLALHRLGVEVIMLSGDNSRAANAIARLAGIDRVVAEVLPAQKADEVRKLQAQGKCVAMVGDGINDAPALMQADVGMAIGTGTDVAMESADITLISDDLMAVATAIALSKATVRNIKQNLFWAFAYNTILIPVAAGVLFPFFGILLDPILAAAAMGLSSVTVVGNALRLKRFRPPA